MTRKMRVVTASFFAAVAFVSVFHVGFRNYFNDTYDPPVPPKAEIVMPPMTKITISNTQGTMTVTSGKGLLRHYSWEGATRSVAMSPRTQVWYGSMGIYSPGAGNHWKDHNGIRRGVLEEGQRHFNSIDEAVSWMNSRRIIYRDDGLAATWFKILKRNQLNVEIWQVYVKDKKPIQLPGSNNDAITVSAMPDAIEISPLQSFFLKLYELKNKMLYYAFIA